MSSFSSFSSSLSTSLWCHVRTHSIFFAQCHSSLLSKIKKELSRNSNDDKDGDKERVEDGKVCFFLFILFYFILFFVCVCVERSELPLTLVGGPCHLITCVCTQVCVFYR